MRLGARRLFQRYNVPVPLASPRPQPEPQPAVSAEPVRLEAAKSQQAKPRVAVLEATGVLIVAVLVLLLTVVRYWRHIPWGAR